MIEGYIDAVAPDGYVEGWARDWARGQRAHVEIRHEGRVVASAVADAFRPDLFFRGGHAHYAFRARLRIPLPFGDCELDLHGGADMGRLNEGGPRLFQVGRYMPHPAVRVADLLAQPHQWTDAEVEENLRCLQLNRNLAYMGASRFADVVYRYILDRWLDDKGGRIYVERLRSGDLSAEVFFREVLHSAERKEMSTPLPSPFDYRFPFVLQQVERDSAFLENG